MKQVFADFAVIGGGGAGLAAALSAHESGVKHILVLEKSPFLGGNSRMAGGQLFAVETPDQFRQGKVMYKDDVFKETMAFHHYSRIKPKILRRFLENAPETVAWLESLGFPYTNIEGTNYMVDGLKPFGNFKKVILKMAELLEAGGHTLLRRTAVTGLSRSEDGLWHITAETPEGALSVTAKAVAITTGGFTGNSELMHRYFPGIYDDNYYFDGLPMDGDGLELARQAGAAMTDYCTLVKEPCHSGTNDRDTPPMAAQQPASLWVNALGERFHDETMVRQNVYTNAIAEQPGNLGYALYDGNVFEHVRTHMDDDEDRPPMPPGMEPGGPGGPGGPPEGDMPMGMPDMEEQMKRAASKRDGWVYTADTWEELAEKIGADPAVLRSTVEEYNWDCDAGHDSLFAKAAKHLVPLRKPPFYAIRFQPILIDTAGPIVIDHNAQVLGDDHRAIPGLYAAGVITSGWQGYDYYLHGSALSYSITFGRLAGHRAAEYLNQ